MQFELWLLGQNAEVQKKYWNLLKASKRDEDHSRMPKHSALEFVLAKISDFDSLDDTQNHLNC